MHLDRYLKNLEEKGLSLLIYKDGKTVFSSTGIGMKPLLEVIESIGRETLRESIVVDKIVGRAAALLIIYMEAGEIYASTMSRSAIEVLRHHNLFFHFDQEVETIKGRDGVEICPFEKLVHKISDPAEAYYSIRAKFASMN